MKETTSQEPPCIIDGLQYAHWSRAVFEQMRAGGVSAVHVTVAYWETCREAISNIARWHELFREHDDLIVPVLTEADLNEARRSGRTGIIHGFQHCSPIGEDLGNVGIFHQLGVRFMQLSYNTQSVLATGWIEREDPGITRFGREVIREMNHVGMIVDMSHSAERSTLEAIDISDHPIVISHANPSAWGGPPGRNKSDTVLKALAESGGMLGLSLYPNHMPDGSATTLESFCKMVERTVELMGIAHVGLGSDLVQDRDDVVVNWMRNGLWRRPEGESRCEWPEPVTWFRSNLDFPRIARALCGHGFSTAETNAIMGGNWERFLRESLSQPALPASSPSHRHPVEPPGESGHHYAKRRQQ